jgi:hypothetical protein
MATALVTGQSTAQSEASAFDGRIDAFLRARRKWIVACCCCFAALRVLVFAASFPLFNPVDEQQHYETIYRYSQGHAPEAALPMADPNVSRVSTLYGSPEYFNSRERLRSFHRDVPIAELPSELKDYHYQKVFKYWSAQPDMEAQSPPAYYLVAAGWYKLGELLGARDWQLAYWVRFLNALFYGAFVWVAYLFVKRIYPQRAFLCVAVPMLLAVFPQDVFYGMNRDVLSPVLVTSVLLLLYRDMEGELGSSYQLIVGGFLTGIAFLADVSNIVLFGVLVAALYVRTRTAVKLGTFRDEGKVIIASALAAVFLPLLWMARNRAVMGDLTGSKAKMAYLGWTLKPWREVWHHPIFSVHGIGDFLHELIRTYWRGEYVWAGTPMHGVYADNFYLFSSYLMFVAFSAYFVSEGQRERKLQQLSNYLSLYLVTASILFMAAISLPFDFHQCVYPSRESPYFVSGRIICGTMLPFVLIYLSGFEFLLRPLRRYIHPVFPLVVLCFCIMYSEVMLMRPVFTSAFNFFALRGH